MMLHRLQETSDSIKKESPNANLRLLVIDLFSAESVRKAAAEVNAYTEPIHVSLAYNPAHFNYLLHVLVIAPVRF